MASSSQELRPPRNPGRFTEEECVRLVARLEQEEVALFYTKTPIELGFVGKLAVARPEQES